MKLLSQIAAADFGMASALVQVDGLQKAIVAAQKANMVQKIPAVQTASHAAHEAILAVAENNRDLVAILYRLNKRIEYVAQRAGLDLEAVEGL